MHANEKLDILYPEKRWWKRDDMNIKRWGDRLFFFAAIAIVLAAYLCSQFFFQLLLIQGDSMLPSYHNMQIVCLNKVNRTFELGDVIAFRCDGLNAVLVKRVAAVPGDMVQILDGTLFVNGEISPIYPEKGCFVNAGILSEAATLKADEYLAIGDNYTESRDSRDELVGLVKQSSILGKVVAGNRRGT